MKKTSLLLAVMLCVLSLSFFACKDKNGNNGLNNAEKYSVTYLSGGGLGSAPETEDKAAGATFTLPENTFIRAEYDFSGWQYGETVYNAGAKFTMPANDVTFTATWTAKVPQFGEPKFSQESYDYDRLGGGDMEIPLDLAGNNIYYVEIDGETLGSGEYSYDEEKSCLVIVGEIMLALTDGEHTVAAITDAVGADTATCTVRVDNSVKTSFDEVTTKDFVYGYQQDVRFNIEFNGTTIKSLKQGDYVVDEKYYEQTTEGISVKGEWLGKNCREGNFTVTLSNNDSYNFTVNTNVIFYTDYDFATIHDITQSNTGLNSLYQYSDNVKIVDGKEGMDGRVLCFTPNTQDVLYDCHSIYTLRQPDFDSTWYNAGFSRGKYYAFSFDYMTEGTSTGTFFFGSRDTDWKFDLLLGEKNDGVLHHFEAIASFNEIKTGTWVRAFFKGAGGKIYFDNFSVTEVDTRPSVSARGEYDMDGDYVLDFVSGGYICNYLLDGQPIDDYVVVNENDTLTIKADALKDLEAGVHTFGVKTPLVTITAEFSVIDSRVCELRDDTAAYDALNKKSVKYYGSFEESVNIVSVKQIAKHFAGGYEDAWNFAQGNLTKNYANLFNLVTGLEDKGYLEIPAEVAELFWGETSFEVSFNTGKTLTITLNSNVILSSNFDDSSVLGYYNGEYKQNSPMYSGMNGNSLISIEERSEGNNALFVRSTENAEAKTIFNMKFMAHVWGWLKLDTNENNQYRVTFTYKMSQGFGENDCYFYIMDRHDSNVKNTFFGSAHKVVDVGGWNQIRWYLTADGQEHVLDTGWFTNTTTTCDLPRLMCLALPDFKQSDDKYVMVDDLKVWETDDAGYFLDEVDNYVLTEDGLKFSTKQEVLNVKINDEEVEFIKNGEVYTLNAEYCNSLEVGTYTLTVIGERGTYVKSFNVVDDRVAMLDETSKYVVNGQGDVFLSGQFDETLTVVSLKRKGSLYWDSTMGNTEVKSDGSMPLSYITLGLDGITLDKKLVDQVYGTMEYSLELSNKVVLKFTLTSNLIFFTNWDETYVQEEAALKEGGGNVSSCQDTSMIEIVDVDGNKMYKYTPTNATLGHSQGGFTGGRDNGILTFANKNFTSEWWNFDFASVETITVFFDYTIVSNGKTPNYEFLYRTNDSAYHSETITGESGKFSIDLDANTLERFYIHCAMTQKSDAEGTYMLIDNFGFGVKENCGVDGNKIYGSHHTVDAKMAELKIKGEFEGGVKVASAMRRAPRMNSAGSLDTAYAAPVEIDSSYFEVCTDGLIVKKQILDMTYGTTRFDLTLTNGITLSVVLKSNVILFIDYDNVMFYDNVSENDSDSVIEWTQDKNMLSIIEIDGNKMMKYTPENTIRTDAISNGNNGALNFSRNGGNDFWYRISWRTTGTITISFDYSIDLGEQTESYFSTFWYDSAHGGFGSEKIDVNGNHYSITFNAEELYLFRIYCPVSDSSLYEGTSMTIDNFKIVLN